MIRKALWLLSVVATAALLAGLGFLYLIRWSPDRGYYQVKFGLARGEPFRIHGRAVDQYGEPVKGYEMALRTFFEEHAASVAHTKVRPFVTRTGQDGSFSFDTAPVKLNGVFYGSKEQDSYIDGVYYHVRGYSGEDIFTLYHGQWIRDARLYSPTPLPHEESKEYIYHVSRSGPPERMIGFCVSPGDRDTLHLRIPKPRDAWFSVNVLAGKILSGKDSKADILIHLQDFDRSCMSWWDCIPLRPFRVEILGGPGSAVQFAKDQSLCEAPPDGYEPMVAVEPQLWEGTPAPPPVPFPWWYFPYIQGDRLGSKKWVAAGTGSAYPPWNLYFQARDKQVYGALIVHPEWTEANPAQSWTMDRPDLLLKVTCIANPRGQRNLNSNGLDSGRSSIPLPVSLPFVEDVPKVDPAKIWACEDPNKKNTLIVEGEKGAVEAGARVVVINNRLLKSSGEQEGRAWQVFGDAQSEGCFSLSLNGREADQLEIRVTRRIDSKLAEEEQIKQLPHDIHTVVLAPRWRLKGR